jgi:fatty-acid peroxygenase
VSPSSPVLPSDATLELLSRGYRFVSDRCDRLGTDVFETRLMGERTVCMRGREAAGLFCDTRLFERAGGFPPRVLKTLLGEGGVQGLDDEAHRVRKQLFLELLGPDRPGVADLTARFTDAWHAELLRWREAGSFELHTEVARLLYRAAHGWLGLPEDPAGQARGTDRMLALIEAPAAVGPRHRRGRRARTVSERWLARVVRQHRDGTRPLPSGCPVDVVARHRDADGEPLSDRVAAVELLNLLRPVVAVARFVVFAALLLHRFPDWRRRLAAPDGADGDVDGDVERFVQEVRRIAPFFPVTAARVREGADFTWHNVDFPAGRRVLLDLYGTDCHPGLWHRPDAFSPERFGDDGPGPDELIPQGCGDHARGHRCPGEWVTVSLLGAAVRILTREIGYRVPPQDLRVSLRRIPALPRSGFVIGDVVLRDGS